MNIYGLLKKSTINAETIKYNKGASEYSKTIRKQLCDSGYWCVASSYVDGFVEKGSEVLAEYSGRYGKGYILCTPHTNTYTNKPSSKYMDIEYFIKD